MEKFKTNLVVVRDGDNLLMIYKKRGFGKGNISFPGGKVEKNEGAFEAGVRECEEETGIIPVDMKKIGLLEFVFPDLYIENEVFYSENFKGNFIKETDETKNDWINIDNIPYNDMWSDDVYWVPVLLKNEKFHFKFYFDSKENKKLVKQERIL